MKNTSFLKVLTAICLFGVNISSVFADGDTPVANRDGNIIGYVYDALGNIINYIFG